jgi:hypothetical protein
MFVVLVRVRVGLYSIYNAIGQNKAEDHRGVEL